VLERAHQVYKALDLAWHAQTEDMATSRLFAATHTLHIALVRTFLNKRTFRRYAGGGIAISNWHVSTGSQLHGPQFLVEHHAHAHAYIGMWLLLAAAVQLAAAA
jgi:hypothetical protein